MKRQIAILIMVLLIVAPVIQDVSAAKTVFITSDNIVDHDTDLKVLNSIKSYIEEISGGELQVIVDNQAPAAGEGWRAIEVTSDVSITLAASDAGNYLQLASSTVNSNKQIVFVNIGDYDLDNHTNFLRRAWDDNYSNESLAGLKDPGTFLKNAGIYYVQPTKEFPGNTDNGILDRYDEDMNKQIAQEIVDIINTHGNDTKVLSDNLVSQNTLKPGVVANASKELINSGDKEMTGTYGNYTAPQLLYQTSSYLNGNGLDFPKSYEEPSNPMGISFLVKDTYSIYDYFKMAGIVREYMDQNGRAPDSIEYEGAHIGYYDLLYNFAKITQNHTDVKHMGFESEYHFDKVNDSILLHVFPFVAILFVLFLAYLLYKRIRRF
ncbi:MAG: adhesin [Methanobrevibacter sp.]|uniref:adhesin n=1 Tax=Methanobrevibacter sp. TaxID=66852 RepID=UPI001B6224A2|nr:adhesin [Methanobrevibacter sp.]MBP3790636.1 adhesin [Methanobrevibacter sp.]